MAGRLTPLGFVLKWIVVPVSLGAIGYFLVGPRVEIPKDIQDKVLKATGKPETVEAENPGGESQGEEDVPQKNYSAPEVDVTVTALNNRPKKKKKKRRRTTTTVSAPSAPEAPVTPPDNGGGAEPPPAGDGT